MGVMMPTRSPSFSTRQRRRHAVVLLAVVLMMVAAILRVVDIRKEL